MANRYKIYEPLGSGGAATVYRAYDTQMKRWVAVKRLIGPGGDPQVIAELRREAGLLASVNSQNIVTVYDVDDDEEGLFMVMELLQGDDLADVLDEGPLSIDDFRELAQQTLEALHTCHTHRIIHRDLKPANIKIDREAGGRLVSKIIDFGISRSGMLLKKQTERQDGMILGSVHYMAPEQIGRSECDHRVDLYSMGCIFYECLSGRKAVDSKDIYELMQKHLMHDITSLQVVSPHLPLPLVGWIESGLMAVKPEERYQTALQALEALGTVELLAQTADTGASAKRKSTSVVQLRRSTTTLSDKLKTGVITPQEVKQLLVSEKKSALPFIAGMLLGICVLAGAALLYLSGKREGELLAAQSLAKPVQTLEPVSTASPAPQPPAKVTAQTENPIAAAPLLATLPKPECQILRFKAGLDTASFKPTNQDKVYSPASLKDKVSYVYNQVPTHKSISFKTVGLEENQAPTLETWENALLLPHIQALEFSKEANSCMGLYRNSKLEQDFPFSTSTADGITLAVVLEVNSVQLPNRVMHLSASEEGSISFRSSGKKTLITEIKLHNNEQHLSVEAENIDLDQPIILVLTWDGKSSIFQVRIKGAKGDSFISQPMTFAPFKKALRYLHFGFYNPKEEKNKDTSHLKFRGYLAEVIYYRKCLDTADINSLEGALEKAYFAR